MTKKRIILIVACAIALMLVTVGGFVFFLTRDKSETPPTQENVTVTFDTQNGSAVQPIVLKKGEKLSKLPSTFLVGHSFMGWCSDRELTVDFDADTPIEKDTVLYARFNKSEVDMDITDPTTVFQEKVPTDFSRSFLSDKALSREEFLSAITVEGISGVVPNDFDVAINGNEYTLTPIKQRVQSSVGGLEYVGFEEGKLYKVTVSDGISFKGQSESIREYTFRVNEEVKQSKENIKYKDDAVVHYVLASYILNLDSLKTTVTETGLDGEEYTYESLARTQTAFICFSSRMKRIKDITSLWEMSYASARARPRRRSHPYS